jgi:hypothetical protein
MAPTRSAKTANLPQFVIPAEAGIHLFFGSEMDPRLRGGDEPSLSAIRDSHV